MTPQVLHPGECKVSVCSGRAPRSARQRHPEMPHRLITPFTVLAVVDADVVTILMRIRRVADL